MMLNRIFKAPEQSFFLMGPRGTGKSTWLRAAFPNAYVIDLLSEEIYHVTADEVWTHPAPINGPT